VPLPKYFAPQSFKHSKLYIPSLPRKYFCSPKFETLRTIFPLWCQCAPTDHTPRVLPPPHTNHPPENSKPLSHPQDHHHVKTSPPFIPVLPTAPLNKIDSSTSLLEPPQLRSRQPYQSLITDGHRTRSSSPDPPDQLHQLRHALHRIYITDSLIHRTKVSSTAINLLHLQG
jgi:hypothetical protein